MSFKALYYCRPRILILSVLLSVFSFFDFLYWQQYASMDNISALIFCFGSILCLIGTSILFMLHSIPFLNENAKKISAIFLLFGGILWFIASCFQLSVDNNYCPLYRYFCEIHVFAYILLPFGTSIILAMDEFFDNIFYYNQRLRITIYSLVLLLSAILFIPYYIELHLFVGLDNMDNIYIEIAFVVIWCGIALSSILMIILIGFCKIHESDKKNIISWISSILLCTGSALLILTYIVQNANNQYIAASSLNDKQFDIDDPIICYHFLVCAECWIVAIDAIIDNNKQLKQYQKI